MLEVLKNTTYRHLFLAQVIALIGTGLITVALALQAYDLAKGEAAQVLGIALAIKMIAYIGVAPIACADSIMPSFTSSNEVSINRPIYGPI